MGRFDLYRYDEKLEKTLKALKDDGKLIEDNRKNIISFSRIRLAKGSSAGRVAKVVYCLRNLSKMLNKPFKDATKEDLIGLIGTLDATKYSDYTKYDYKIVLKMFYKWLLGDDETAPAVIKWFRPRLKNEKHKLPEELITEDEVLKLAETADHPRDKALIMVLYESGCRIGELLSLKMKHISVDQYGAVLMVDGKTGCRRVRIISSSSLLSAWINNYPNSGDPEAPLWPPRSSNHLYKKEPVEHASIYRVLGKLSKKAGIKKKIYPHLFRHSRATALAGKLTEAQMKEHFGWTKDSDMAGTYVHLSGRDVDNALLQLHGMTNGESKKEEKMKVRPCMRCRENNSPVSKYCTRCGTPMDEALLSRIDDERKNSDNLMNTLMKDKEFKEFMMKKIFDMRLNNQIS